jgi:SdpI/YfhL protein family
MVMIILGIIEVLSGLVVIRMAVVGWQGGLARTGAVGVRTATTVRSDEAFRVANKVAAPLTGIGGAVLAAGGVLTAVVPKHLVGIPLFGGVGLFLVLCLLGAVKGIRACR